MDPGYLGFILLTVTILRYKSQGKCLRALDTINCIGDKSITPASSTHRMLIKFDLTVLSIKNTSVHITLVATICHHPRSGEMEGPQECTTLVNGKSI